MKKNILFIMLFISISTFSQSRVENGFINAFESDSVVWRSCLELGFEGVENPISETVLYGDTLMNGFKWRIFHLNPSISGGVKGLVRMEDRKVIFTPYPGYEEYYMRYYRENETIIYDFSLEVGDRTELNGEVLKIDSIAFNDGHKHKKIHVETWSSFIEGLGSDVFDPFYMLFPFPTMASFPTFMCCHVNGELLYMNPDYSDCDGNKVSNEVINDNHLKVNVTLSGEILRIKPENNNSYDVALYNINGLLLKQQKKNVNETIMQLSNFAKGIYIVYITSGNKTYSQKIYMN